MFKLAVNTMALDGKIPAGDPRWGVFNDSFVNQELELIDLANVIYAGRSYSGWHEGRRKIENFICAQHIAIDMDTEDKRSTIEVLSANTFVRTYAALIHTTASHTAAAPRARVIFLLDQPIENAEAYQKVAKLFISKFPGADQACSDASRFFYGAKNCEIWMHDNVLPLAQLRRYYRQWLNDQTQDAPQSYVSREQNDKREETPDALIAEAIAKAQEGRRNIEGYFLALHFARLHIPQYQAREYLLAYQRAVESGKTKYTEVEALRSLGSAYKGMN